MQWIAIAILIFSNLCFAKKADHIEFLNGQIESGFPILDDDRVLGAAYLKYGESLLRMDASPKSGKSVSESIKTMVRDGKLLIFRKSPLIRLAKIEPTESDSKLRINGIEVDLNEANAPKEVYRALRGKKQSFLKPLLIEKAVASGAEPVAASYAIYYWVGGALVAGYVYLRHKFGCNSQESKIGEILKICKRAKTNSSSITTQDQVRLEAIHTRLKSKKLRECFNPKTKKAARNGFIKCKSDVAAAAIKNTTRKQKKTGAEH